MCLINQSINFVHEKEVAELGAISFERHGIVKNLKEGSQPRKFSVLLPVLDFEGTSVAHKVDPFDNDNDLVRKVVTQGFILHSNMRFRERRGEKHSVVCPMIPPPRFYGTLVCKEVASNHFRLFVCGGVPEHISCLALSKEVTGACSRSRQGIPRSRRATIV